MATFFVSTTGNDSTGTGSQLSPWRTVAKGVSGLNPGDTLYMRGGTYLEPIHMTRLGSAGSPITVSGFTAETAIIRMPAGQSYHIGSTVKQYHTYQNFTIDGQDSTEGLASGDNSISSVLIGIGGTNASHDVTLDNLEIKNTKDVAIYIDCIGPNIVIRNCLIHDALAHDTLGERNYGIYCAHVNGVLIEDNEIYNCPGGGIQVYPNPVNATIRRNSIHHNNTLSLASVGGILIQQDLTLGPAITGLLVYNNLIYNNGTATSGNAYGIKCNNVVAAGLYNNTIYNNKSWGIGVGDNSAGGANGTLVKNNITWQNGLGPITTGFTGTVNTVLTTNLSTNPSFTNPAAFDLTLLNGSAAINTGTSLSSIFTTDYLGVSRPQGAAWDIGAYEFAVSGDTTAPATPTGLQVV